MASARLACFFGAVLLCLAPSCWRTALAEDHYFVFSACKISFGRIRATVHPGDTVTMQCPGAISSNPADVSKYACPGEDPNCTETTRASYQTLFPKAPADFEFWSGSDSMESLGVLHIPPETDEITISYSWQAALSRSTGHAAESRLILDIEKSEEEVVRTRIPSGGALPGCELPSLLALFLAVVSAIAMH
ncbi:conserved hypothetical protein [Neospora caninum Liverpool]|uniref:SAG-related sequence SRS25 n=1 Tax=Neospora caninum (strain Liverpool) TaxID=572307 RepID=F0VD18_NEOCL|nr:conserved hypothetical protein [Neospora caninum Liverpool]CBZ51533.1 conserved hypothetical protein [Neospora caninum Liverpool]CEL65483.1 TPA: SAG-related sequence SRS25 [Neospora caninum Liverpool]|eukprot:XP_003881566.1 conserved hypothetical protein [Neospora caninum Liverpool]